MITVPEAARRVGRNPETVRRWIRSGRLRSQKVGTQHLVEESELEALCLYDEQAETPESWGPPAFGPARLPVVWAIRLVREGR